MIYDALRISDGEKQKMQIIFGLVCLHLPFCIAENPARLARSGACGTAGGLSRGAAIKHFKYH